MLRLVRVKFLDSCTHDHWTALPTIRKEMTSIPCQAVGWLVEENDKEMKLSSLINEFGQVSGMTIVIPKGGHIIEDIRGFEIQEGYNPAD